MRPTRTAGRDFAASRYAGCPDQRQLAGMHRARAAECQQREVARIETALDRDHANRALHIGVDHADDSARCRQARWSSSDVPARDKRAPPVGMELHLPAQEILRDQPARDKVRVGYSANSPRP